MLQGREPVGLNFVQRLIFHDWNPLAWKIVRLETQGLHFFLEDLCTELLCPEKVHVPLPGLNP